MAPLSGPDGASRVSPPVGDGSPLYCPDLAAAGPGRDWAPGDACGGDKALPPAVLQEVVRKTDGVPLFVEELTKTVLTSGLLEEQADRYALLGPLPRLAIPATLHDALLARLDRLAAA